MGLDLKPNKKYRSTNISPDDNWLQGSGNQVYKGRDQILNILNNSDHVEPRRILDTEKQKTDEELMAELSPFGQKSDTIRHEVVTSDNFRRKEGDKILEDENGDKDLEYREGGKIYNMSFHEYVQHPETEKKRIDRNNLDQIDKELGLLTVHTIIYNDPEKGEHILHWDPGRSLENSKEKYREVDGQPSPFISENKWSGDDLFEDYSNQKLGEGLQNISKQLHDMKEQLYSEADRKMLKNSARNTELAKNLNRKMEEDGLESLKRYKKKLDQQTDELGYSKEVRKTVWKAERWRAMANVIEAFRQSYSKGAEKDILRGQK